MTNIFEEKIKKDLKSFYIIDDDKKETMDLFFDFLVAINMSDENRSNILFEEYESFTIDKSRSITKLHSEKNGDKGQIFVIKVKYFTHEAQNALLKLFEDTNHRNYFFIFCVNTEQFLDTVLSRAFVVKIKKEDKIDIGKKFLKQDQNQRLKNIEEIIKSHKSDSDSAGLRNHARELIDGIESYLHENIKYKKDHVSIFEEINNARKYISTPGASVKMILEHLSLVI